MKALGTYMVIFLAILLTGVSQVFTQCGSRYYDDSYFTLTFPASPSPLTCIYIFETRSTEKDIVGVLKFTTFEISNDGRNTSLNYLSVYDSSDNLLGNFTEKFVQGITAEKNGGYMIKVIFTASHDPSRSKFVGSFQTFNISDLYSTKSTYISGTEDGNVTSPGYPNNYPGGGSFHQKIITADLVGTIKLTFQDFDLGPKESGSKLYIYDDLEGVGYPLYTFNSGDYIGGIYYTSGNQFSWTLKTSPGKTYRGFLLKYVEYCMFDAREIPCKHAHVKDSIRDGIIVGASLGIIIFLLLIIVLGCWCCRKREEAAAAKRAAYEGSTVTYNKF